MKQDLVIMVTVSFISAMVTMIGLVLMGASHSLMLALGLLVFVITFIIQFVQLPLRLTR